VGEGPCKDIEPLIKEYLRSGFWHTDTVENDFSILKRGIVGAYNHVSQQHLERYLAECGLRHSECAALSVNDGYRAGKALRGIVKKWLMYRD